MNKVSPRRAQMLQNSRFAIAQALVFFMVWVMAKVTPTTASIIEIRHYPIDFTSTNAALQCSWSPTNLYGITAEGLGWDNAPDQSEVNAGWILTNPIGVGFRWRTTTSVSVKVAITPTLTDRRAIGTYNWRYPGQIYVRHSPDLVHWSSWQALQVDTTTNGVFSGVIEVPRLERSAYEVIKLNWESKNPSKSDNEEEAVKAIIKEKPEFFSKNIPFVGHVQILFEGYFVSGYRYKRMETTLGYSVGGLRSADRDEKEEKEFYKVMYVPWEFDARKKAEHSGKP